MVVGIFLLGGIGRVSIRFLGYRGFGYLLLVRCIGFPVRVWGGCGRQGTSGVHSRVSCGDMDLGM